MDNITPGLLRRRLDVIKLINDTTCFNDTIAMIFGSKSGFTQKLLVGPTGNMGEYGVVGDPYYMDYNHTVKLAEKFWQDVENKLA